MSNRRLHWAVFIFLAAAIGVVLAFWGGLTNVWAALVAGCLTGQLAWIGHPMRRRK